VAAELETHRREEIGVGLIVRVVRALTLEPSSGGTWRWARRASALAEVGVIETSRKAAAATSRGWTTWRRIGARRQPFRVAGVIPKLADGSAVRRFADLDDMADLAECIRKQET
jgi:hypothetical protein